MVSKITMQFIQLKFKTMFNIFLRLNHELLPREISIKQTNQKWIFILLTGFVYLKL